MTPFQFSQTWTNLNVRDFLLQQYRGGMAPICVKAHVMGHISVNRKSPRPASLNLDLSPILQDLAACGAIKSPTHQNSRRVIVFDMHVH